MKTFEGFATACLATQPKSMHAATQLDMALGRTYLDLAFVSMSIVKLQPNLSLIPVIKDTDDPVNKSKLKAEKSSSRETRVSVSERATRIGFV